MKNKNEVTIIRNGMPSCVLFEMRESVVGKRTGSQVTRPYSS